MANFGVLTSLWTPTDSAVKASILPERVIDPSRALVENGAGGGLMKMHRLKDGSPVLIRPIRPEDKEKIRQGVTQLSSRSLYFRFLRAVRELTDRELEYLTQVDGVNHFALVATNAEQTRGLAVARWVRLADEPQVGEFAITVLDSHHGLGLATLLLSYIVASGRRAGLRTLRAWIHRENTGMEHLFRKAGAKLTGVEGGVGCYDLSLRPFP